MKTNLVTILSAHLITYGTKEMVGTAGIMFHYVHEEFVLILRETELQTVM